MACKYNENFAIPQNFSQIYHDFLQSLIKDKPNDIIDYGALYFEAKHKGIDFKYIDPALREKTVEKEAPKKITEEVVLDGPIEDYEKTALLMQKKFRATKIIKAKKEEKHVKNN